MYRISQLSAFFLFILTTFLVQPLWAQSRTISSKQDNEKACAEYAAKLSTDPMFNKAESDPSNADASVDNYDNQLSGVIRQCEHACSSKPDCSRITLQTLAKLYTEKARLRGKESDHAHHARKAMQAWQCVLSESEDNSPTGEDEASIAMGQLSVDVGLLTIDLENKHDNDNDGDRTENDIKKNEEKINEAVAEAELFVNDKKWGNVCLSPIAFEFGEYVFKVKRDGKTINKKSKFTIASNNSSILLEIPPRHRAWFWSGIGVGVSGIIAIGVGAGFGFKTLDDEKKLESQCPDNLCPPWSDNEVNTYREHRSLSHGFLWPGVAAIATGISLLSVDVVKHRKRSKTKPPSCIKPWISPGEIQLSVSGEF